MRKLKEIYTSKKALEKLLIAYSINRSFQRPLKKS
jgi:hypothetical protein